MQNLAEKQSELTLDSLMSMRRTELETLYRSSLPGQIPDGESRGVAAVSPGTKVGRVSQRLFSYVWKGKVFDRKEGALVNKILGARSVKAEVYAGKSWLDGRDSIIIDYSRTSRIAAVIRDEIRQVGPSLYLGFAYLRAPGNPQLLAFALDFSKTAP